MRNIKALVLDMDGTLISDGRPPESDLVKVLSDVKRADVKLLLATGRCVREVYERFDASLFDGLVAEDGAVLDVAGIRTEVAPPGWDRVRARLFRQFEPGCEEVIVSAEREKLELARALVSESEARIGLNKDRLMIVPRGVDKGTGTRTVLTGLGLSPVRTACIGDGENDNPMFDVAGVKLALENSVDSLKLRADYIAAGSDGAGAMEAIGWLFPRQRGKGGGRR